MDKITIIGAGSVGATAAFAMVARDVASEITLVDAHSEKAVGEAMDLEHGMQFAPGSKVSFCDDFGECGAADIVIITAGAAQKPGETRLDLVNKNAAIFKKVIPEIAATAPDAIIMVVTNPVDIMTHFAIEYSGFPVSQVFGTGTTLDSARFRYLLGRHFGVNPSSVHAYIIGEHGDTEFPVWSRAEIGGTNLAGLEGYDPVAMEDIFRRTKNAAYEIISRKGATYYAVGLVVAELCEAVLRDKNQVFPVSTMIDDYYGESGICLSVPAVLGRGGITRKIKITLDPDEQAALHRSASVLREIKIGVRP